MQRHMFAAILLAAAILVAIFAAAPSAVVTTNAASTEIYGIDFFNTARNASAAPQELSAARVPRR